MVKELSVNFPWLQDCCILGSSMWEGVAGTPAPGLWKRHCYAVETPGQRYTVVYMDLTDRRAYSMLEWVFPSDESLHDEFCGIWTHYRNCNAPHRATCLARSGQLFRQIELWALIQNSENYVKMLHDNIMGIQGSTGRYGVPGDR